MSSISNLKDIKFILLGSGVKPADIVNGSSDKILQQLVELKHNPSLPLNFEFYSPIHRASYQKQKIAELKADLQRGKISKALHKKEVDLVKSNKIDKHLDFIQQAIAKVQKFKKYGDPIV